MDLVTLKSLAYDQLVIIEQAQLRLRKINEQIAELDKQSTGTALNPDGQKTDDNS